MTTGAIGPEFETNIGGNNRSIDHFIHSFFLSYSVHFYICSNFSKRTARFSVKETSIVLIYICDLVKSLLIAITGLLACTLSFPRIKPCMYILCKRYVIVARALFFIA